MRRLTAFLFTACLALPIMAADYARPERQEQFGALTVHYNAFASSMLQPAVAQAAGLVRSKNQGVLNVTAIKDGKTVTATVSGTVKDLTGRARPLPFKPLTDQGSVNYLAQFAVEQKDTFTFTITIKAAGEDEHSFSFSQDIYPGQ